MILQEIVKKDNTWNIRGLVYESFARVSKQTSVLYWRLTDFKKCDNTFMIKKYKLDSIRMLH